ncbi:MAG: glycosylase [Oscillospiraceae bacterium]|nr:glycosylase [Oscillospiraceae bacterium]
MPKWLENAVFYEIYPQSFLDTDGDGIGNISGITKKLDYIKELGCNAIWINPCFESPFGDAGYDVSDYKKIAPRYGTNQDMSELFAEAHKRGMHIILDLVPGHTSVEHPWFRESVKAEKNIYSDRYVWTDSIWESPNGMDSLRGISDRDGCCALNFFSHQPALNYGFANPDRPWQMRPEDEGPMATREAIKDIMRFWLKMGCDGFRVDMAGSLVKNDPDGQATVRLWQDFREFLDKEFPEAAMVSEWGEPDKSLMGGFHMDFLLHFGPSHYNDLFRCDEPYFSKRGKGSAKEFIAKYKENYEKTGGRGLICIPSGNHDMDRLARRLDNDELKTAFAFLLSMPGAPFIYYGDEIGMRYVEGLVSKEGGYGRTGSRSPMQWDNTLNCGFSAAAPEKLYIPQDNSSDRPDVLSQMTDENSVYSEVKKLIGIRQSHKALQSMGTVEFISDGYPLIYIRSCDEEKLLIMINPSSEEKTAELSYDIKNIIYGNANIDSGRITIKPCSAVFAEI